jgi:hypothetical protein
MQFDQQQPESRTAAATATRAIFTTFMIQPPDKYLM